MERRDFQPRRDEFRPEFAAGDDVVAPQWFGADPEFEGDVEYDDEEFPFRPREAIDLTGLPPPPPPAPDVPDDGDSTDYDELSQADTELGEVGEYAAYGVRRTNVYVVDDPRTVRPVGRYVILNTTPAPHMHQLHAAALMEVRHPGDETVSMVQLLRVSGNSALIRWRPFSRRDNRLWEIRPLGGERTIVPFHNPIDSDDLLRPFMVNNRTYHGVIGEELYLRLFYGDAWTQHFSDARAGDHPDFYDRLVEIRRRYDRVTRRLDMDQLPALLNTIEPSEYVPVTVMRQLVTDIETAETALWQMMRDDLGDAVTRRQRDFYE